ncbi:hypothetical protein M3P05_20685, partial [Sansalvadorimonas sp. 2012CJ34-2]
MCVKLINSLPKKTDKELESLKVNSKKKENFKVLEAVKNEISRRHPILANNCRGFDHVKEYGENAVMDCIPDQLGKISITEVRDIVCFKYVDNLIQIDTYENCRPRDVTIADSDDEFAKHAGKPGICFFGNLVNSETVTKEHAATL